MDQFEKQQILDHIADDIKRMVAREVNEVVKKNVNPIPSRNSIMSNAIANANSVYGDFNIKLNQQAYTNESVYIRMKNKIQYRNSTNSSSFINKGKQVSV